MQHVPSVSGHHVTSGWRRVHLTSDQISQVRRKTGKCRSRWARTKLPEWKRNLFKKPFTRCRFHDAFVYFPLIATNVNHFAARNYALTSLQTRNLAWKIRKANTSFQNRRCRLSFRAFRMSSLQLLFGNDASTAAAALKLPHPPCGCAPSHQQQSQGNRGEKAEPTAGTGSKRCGTFSHTDGHFLFSGLFLGDSGTPWTHHPSRFTLLIN